MTYSVAPGYTVSSRTTRVHFFKFCPTIFDADSQPGQIREFSPGKPVFIVEIPVLEKNLIFTPNLILLTRISPCALSPSSQQRL